MLIPEGPSGAFDDESADWPAVIVDGYMFEVWYSGHDGDKYEIGYATGEWCGPGARLDETVYLPLVMRDWDGSTPCSPYYADDFSDDASGWPIDDDENARFAYTGGEYQIWLKNASWWGRATPWAKAVDFTAVVSARRTGGSDGAYGIQFGINEEWTEYHIVLIGYGDEYSIWRYDDGDWTALRDWTVSEHIATGTDWNRLAVVRDGTDIAVYVNGHHLTTVTDTTYTGLRRIGLTAMSTESGPLDARFDDFAMYSASCSATVASTVLDTARPGIQQGSMRSNSVGGAIGTPVRLSAVSVERGRSVPPPLRLRR
jgi:hypothetical protein